MDMLSYFLGRLAGGTGGSGGDVVIPSGPYTKIIYNDNNTLTLIDTKNNRHTIAYEYDLNGKIVSLKHNEASIAISYDSEYPHILKKYGNVKINFGALFGVEIKEEEEESAILNEDGIVVSYLQLDANGIVSGNMSINDGIVTL
jgi:YD repeat-containing protein